MSKHRRPTPLRYSAAALLAVGAAFAALFLALAPNASAASITGTGQTIIRPGCGMLGGAVTPDRQWVASVVGCSTEVDDATVEHLIVLREADCEGLRADVPAARIVAVTAADLGDRTEAVTLFTAASRYCYGG